MPVALDLQIQAAISYRRRFGEDPPTALSPAAYINGERACKRTWAQAKKAGFTPSPVAFLLIDGLLRRGINTHYDMCEGSYKLRLAGEWQCPDCGKRTVAEHMQDRTGRTGMIHFPHSVPEAK